MARSNKQGARFLFYPDLGLKKFKLGSRLLEEIIRNKKNKGFT